jgi:putrescine transport system substrate-binding protein
MKRTLLLATAVTFTAGAVAAQDNVVNVYNWSDYIAEDTIEKFEAATGIKVVYDVFDSNEVLEAKMLTGNSGYDVVVPTSDFLQRQVAAGAYQPLDKSKLPNLANMDADLMAGAAVYDPDNEYAFLTKCNVDTPVSAWVYSG